MMDHQGSFPSNCCFLFGFQAAFSVKQSLPAAFRWWSLMFMKEVTVCPRYISVHTESSSSWGQDLTCPISKGEGELFSDSGLDSLTKEKLPESRRSALLSSRAYLENPGSQGQEKTELENPTERCTILDKSCFSLFSWVAPRRSSLHNLARNHRADTGTTSILFQ